MTEEQPYEAETAFIVVKRRDGSFYATVDLASSILVDRSGTRSDVKQGCHEIIDAALVEDTTLNILTALTSPPSESEKVSGSIRQALSDKGIL